MGGSQLINKIKMNHNKLFLRKTGGGPHEGVELTIDEKKLQS